MSVKAICVLNDIVGRDAANHTKFYVGINYVVLNEINMTGTTYFYDLDPNVTKVALISDIEARAKAFLETQGVVFGPSDTVLVLNGPATS